jgi:hypothetical protein
METCVVTAWRELGDDSVRVLGAYNDLGNKLLKPLMPTINARLDPGLPAKLMSCLGGAGYRARDEQAFLNRPDPRQLGVRLGEPELGAAASWKPQRVPGTVQVGPQVPARPYQATPEEGALAVAWLRCRQRTSMADQQLRVAVEVQRELVAKHETAFEELNPLVRRIAKHAAALLGAA